jgi:hypothetical protein
MAGEQKRRVHIDQLVFRHRVGGIARVQHEADEIAAGTAPAFSTDLIKVVFQPDNGFGGAKGRFNLRSTARWQAGKVLRQSYELFAVFHWQSKHLRDNGYRQRIREILDQVERSG